MVRAKLPGGEQEIALLKLTATHIKWNLRTLRGAGRIQIWEREGKVFLNK